MNTLVSVLSTWMVSSLIFIFIAFPAYAEDTGTGAGDTVIEMVEEDLTEQGAIEDLESTDEEEDSETSEGEQAPERLLKSSAMEAAASMAESPTEPVPPSLEESVFDTSSAVIVPEIAMGIGAAVLEYPIRVPSGRNGLTPAVALNYNSSRRNGTAGVGWAMTTSSIKRSTKRGACYTCNRFTYNGEEIFPVSVDANGYGTYRPEKQQAFSVIEFKTDNSWSVTLKNGTVQEFGPAPETRQDNSHGTFQWLLSSVLDTNGNTLTYSYIKDQGQVYLSAIQYLNYYTVAFYYENRPDPIINYSSNARVVTAKRLKTVAIFSNVDQIRAYGLAYTPSANTGRSLLTQITRYGSDYSLDAANQITGGSSLPPTQITYAHDRASLAPSSGPISDLAMGQGFTNTYVHPMVTGDWNGDGKTDLGRAGASSVDFYISGNNEFQAMDSLFDLSEGQGYTNANTNPVLTGDWNGDGKTDIGRVGNSGMVFYTSTGAGWESYPQLNALSIYQGYGEQSQHPVFTGDWNGDGKTDVGRITADAAVFYVSTGTGWQSYNGFSDLAGQQGYADISRHPAFTGDFNGDGRTDVARAGSVGVKAYISTGTGFRYYGSLPVFGWSTHVYNSQGLYPLVTGDFNGDGMTDIARAGANQVFTYLSTGTGFAQGGQINDLTMGQGCKDYNTHPIFTGDFNDDGRIDIGRVKAGSLAVYVSTGTGFTAYGSPISNFSPAQWFSTNHQCPLVTGDFNGDGRTGIARASTSGVSFYSPQGGGNDLMHRISAASGSITDIEYTPSTAWADTRLPMVLRTVSKLTVKDGLGNTSATEYSYSGGLYDFQDRELRAFESVVKTHPDGTTDTRLFHQDRFLDGRTKRFEFKAPDGTLLSQTDYTWEGTPYDNDTAFIRLTSQTETQYDEGSQAVRQVDYTYDTNHGSLLTSTVSGTNLAESVTTSYSYDYYGAGLDYPLRTIQETLTGSTSGMVRETLYTYELHTGNMLTREQVNAGGINPITTYTYDAHGNLASLRDPKDNVTLFDYDPTIATWPVRVEKPATGIYTHVVRHPDIDLRFGKPLTFENENGFQTAYAYDVHGRLVQVDFPDGGRETYIYDDTAMPRSLTQRIKESDSSSIDAVTYTDGLGRTVQTTAKSKDEYTATLFTFDTMGRQACVKGPFFTSTNAFLAAAHTGLSADPATVNTGVTTTWVRNHYDDKGRITKLEQSGGINTRFTHNTLTTRATDPDGHSKSQVRDILGRIIKVIEHGPADFTASYTYTPAGDMVKVSRTNPDTGNPIENVVAYNTLGQKTAMTDPDMGNWTYTYDLNGNLATQTDARNVTLTFEYDALNRLTRKTYPDASSASWAYDAGTNGIGLLYETSNANATTRYTAYDQTGRLASETRTVDSQTVRFDYTWDPAGRPASRAVTHNNTLFKTLAYEFYPGTRLLARVKQEDNRSITEITQYSPQGKIVFLNHLNGTVANYIYDFATSRLILIHSYNLSETIMDKGYTYTKAGDVEMITDNRTNKITSYAYDHNHRLISEMTAGTGAVTGTSVEVIEFTYEEAQGAPVHAPKEVKINGSLTEYAYTATGNRSFKNNGVTPANYESNADNMISRITVGAVETQFFYDADNKRVKKAGGPAASFYFGDRFEVVNGRPTYYVFAGNLRVAQVTATGMAFFHKDHLGSTEAITREDGSLIDFGAYFPYGLDRSANALLQHSAYKFTDQEQDEGTGLYNYDARLYDPEIGQFVMADTIVPEPFNPQSLNRYAYCLNNPVRYTDPSGHAPGDMACGNCHTPGMSEKAQRKAVNTSIGFIGQVVGNLGIVGMAVGDVLGAYATARTAYDKTQEYDDTSYFGVTKLGRTKKNKDVFVGVIDNSQRKNVSHKDTIEPVSQISETADFSFEGSVSGTPSGDKGSGFGKGYAGRSGGNDYGGAGDFGR
ncbi:MAG: VCBS repeat-containing protein [Desulfobacter sp.]|nr:MAG: VCBS repeat-containing protein [Desulfobacter sp.]